MDKSVLAISQVPQNGASCANRLSRLEDRRFFRFRHFIRLFVFHAEKQETNGVFHISGLNEFPLLFKNKIFTRKKQIYTYRELVP